MKILVCFRLVTDPERVLEEDLQRFSLRTDLGYAGSELNCFDESALELALKLRQEAAVQEISCTALTVSDSLSPEDTQRLLSVGFDRVLRIPGGGECQPETVARAIVRGARGYDLILMGREAGIGESGMVPYLTARDLGYPIQSGVEDGAWEEGPVLLCRENGDLWRRRVRLPLVAVVDNSPLVLRVPTLRQRMQFRGREPELLPGVPDRTPQTLEFYRPDSQRRCRMLEPEAEETWKLLRELLKTAAESQNREASQEKRMLPDHPLLQCLPDTEAGREQAVRLMKEQQCSCRFDCRVCALGENSVTVTRRVFGSSLELRETLALPAVITCRDRTGEQRPDRDFVVSQTLEAPGDNRGLAGASLVFACGSGLGSRENCETARRTAEYFGAAFGLTRPGALNAWGSTQEILGQSGLQICPRCCLVLGAAGAGAFLAGIQGAETLIAVNTDPNALIFKNADYGICMDAMEFLTKLEGK